MPAAFENSPEFRRLIESGPGPTAGPDLARIALEIAADVDPALDVEGHLARIDALARRVRDRCPDQASPREAIGHVNWVLFVEEGFRGNVEDYYDPRNSYLNEVLDRKLGIPITLCVLYLRVTGRVGPPLAGVDVPAHFMLRTLTADPVLFVDPFDAGAVLDAEGCRRRVVERAGRELVLDEHRLAPCASVAIVLRMLRNLKAIHVQEHDYAAALPVQRRIAALAHSDPDEQRDLAMLCLHVDRPGEAIGPLESYLGSAPDSPVAADLRALLRLARRESAGRN